MERDVAWICRVAWGGRRLAGAREVRGGESLPRARRLRVTQRQKKIAINRRRRTMNPPKAADIIRVFRARASVDFISASCAASVAVGMTVTGEVVVTTIVLVVEKVVEKVV